MNNKGQKKTNNVKKLNIIILIIGLILIIGALLINNDSLIRPLLWVTGLITILINIIILYKPPIIQVLLIFVILFISSLILDSITVITFQKIPVFSYNIINSGQTRVYKAIGVRVWQCDINNYKDIKVSSFYNRGYICNTNSIPAVEINSFLNSVVENYDDYKNSYIKINGKISKKTGQNYLEMQPYEKTNLTINGYVTFANNITLRILFKENNPILDQYDIYDEITIIGIIKNMDNYNNNYVIYMDDSQVVSNIELSDYKISVTEETTCSTPNIIYSNEKMNLYTYCLEDMIIKYASGKTYELSNALSSNKINVEDLFKNPQEELTNDDKSIIYDFENYRILICDSNQSKDVFISSKEIDFKSVTCHNITNNVNK